TLLGLRPPRWQRPRGPHVAEHSLGGSDSVPAWPRPADRIALTALPPQRSRSPRRALATGRCAARAAHARAAAGAGRLRRRTGRDAWLGGPAPARAHTVSARR